MSTLPVVWVMMGLRFLGAGPSEEGKWLPYQIPYETKEACLAAKADALNSENIHRSYLDCIPFKAMKQPPSNPDKREASRVVHVRARQAPGTQG
jgi:hypothetical protein